MWGLRHFISNIHVWYLVRIHRRCIIHRHKIGRKLKRKFEEALGVFCAVQSSKTNYCVCGTMKKNHSNPRDIPHDLPMKTTTTITTTATLQALHITAMNRNAHTIALYIFVLLKEVILFYAEWRNSMQTSIHWPYPAGDDNVTTNMSCEMSPQICHVTKSYAFISS